MLKKLFLIGVTLMVAVGAFMAFAVYQDKNRVREPDEAAFEAAEELIGKYETEVAFGSDEAAKKIAFAFAKQMKTSNQAQLIAQRAALEVRLDHAESKGATKDVQKQINAIDGILKEGGVSLSEGNFLTYVRINPGSLVFLVHVPRLKKYQGEMRTDLLTLAWKVAKDKAAAALAQLTGERELVVALKGSVFYGAVAKDVYDTDQPFVQTSGSVNDEPLHKYFDPKLLDPLSPEAPEGPAASAAPSASPAASPAGAY